MKQYKLISAFILLMGTMNVQAQLIAYKTVLANAGTSYSSAGLSADWTVGQNITNQYTGSGLTITEGFHPIYIATASIPNGVPAISSNINSVIAYPNPTNAILHVSIQQKEPKTVSMQVLDITGKLVQNVIMLSAQSVINTDIDLSATSPGTYIIQLNANTPDAYTMKVTKQ